MNWYGRYIDAYKFGGNSVSPPLDPLVEHLRDTMHSLSRGETNDE